MARAANAGTEFAKLSRRHGIKISTSFPCSVEECSLAVGKIVGYENVKSAARMNSACVIFLDDIEKTNKVIETGVVISDTFVQVLPLSSPAKRVIISNIPPFISDDLLIRELARYGKIVSPIRKLSSGCKSSLLRHVVSHRRQVNMFLNKKDEALSLTFTVKVDEYEYVIFVTSETSKCFGCGGEGHIVKDCPTKSSAANGGKSTEKTQSQAEATGETQGQNQEQNGAEPEKEKQNNTEEESENVSQNVDGNSENSGETQAEKSAEGQEEDMTDDADKPAATVVTGNDSATELVEEEISAKKSSVKRKSSEGQKEEKGKVRWTRGRQVPVSSDSEDDMHESGQDSEYQTEDDASRLKTRKGKPYSVEKIKKFLQSTKNMKGVKVEDHFEDQEVFIVSARSYMYNWEKAGFSKQEMYRLKKLVQRSRHELNNGVDSV